MKYTRPFPTLRLVLRNNVMVLMAGNICVCEVYISDLVRSRWYDTQES